MLKGIILTLCLLFFPWERLQAQSYSWDDFLRDCITNEEWEEEENLEGWMEELQEMHEHPININTATVDELLRLPFLDEMQIEQIHAYIYLHGEMQTLGELKMVPMLHIEAMKALPLFVYAASTNQKKDKWPNHWHHSLTSRMDIPMYYRKGQLVENGYTGDALYHNVKYKLEDERHWLAGVRMEKDAGERYYDSYGAFAQASSFGMLNRLIVGDYKVGFGEGLVMGGNLFLSKSNLAQHPGRGLRPMTGMDETHYLRGAAATLQLTDHLEITLLTSYRQLDATLNAEGHIQTLRETGYHRTRAEKQSQANVGNALAGGNLTWNRGGFHAGITGYWEHYSHTMDPGKALYRHYYPRGSSQTAIGTHYGYSRYRLSLAGETARGGNLGGWATLNRASWTLNRRYILSAQQRFYSKKYYAHHATALSESGSVTNESGVLIQLTAQPWNQWDVQGYLDFFYNPWPRFGMTHSSAGQEGMIQLGWKAGEQHKLLVRYQTKRKESQDVMQTHQHLRLQWTTEASPTIKLLTEGLLHLANKPGSATESGFAALERLQWKRMDECWQASGLLAYFQTTSYESRLFTIEPRLFETMSHAMLYGKGFRGVAQARWQSKDKIWMAEARWGTTCFTDRKEQGQGLQLIKSRWKNDLSMLIRIRI